MSMKVEIKDNKLYIEIDLETPTPSASGKTLVVATTRDNTVTTALVDSKPVTIRLDAYISHAVRDPNGRDYNRTSHLAGRRKMMQIWADYLDGLKSGSNVIPSKS